MSNNRDIELLHPLFQNNLDEILRAIQKKLPKDYTCKMISGHRSPSEQFDLYKKGRRFRNGSWRVSNRSQVVTNINGITKLSKHNYLPCISIDIGIFDENGKYMTQAQYYKHVKEGAKLIDASWGGDWRRFVDMPHIQLSRKHYYKGSIIRTIAIEWQKLLKEDGTYSAALDGYFGRMSRAALRESVGSDRRDIKAWKTLIKRLKL